MMKEVKNNDYLIAMCNPNKNDKESQDDEIATNHLETNIPFMKYFVDKYLANSFEQINKIYRECAKKWLILMMLQKKHKRTQSKLEVNSWSSIQNINNQRLWIGKRNTLINLTNDQLDIDKI